MNFAEECGLVVRYEFPAYYIELCKNRQDEIRKAFNHPKLVSGDFYGTGCTCERCRTRQDVFNEILDAHGFPWLDDILMHYYAMLDEKDYPIWYPRYDQLWVKAWDLRLYAKPDGDPWDNDNNNDKDKVVIPIGFIQKPTKMLEDILEKELRK